MQQHLEQSVLLKLPDSYQSPLKQSAISEEDDMGILNTFSLHVLSINVYKRTFELA